MNDQKDQLITLLGGLAHNPEEQSLIAAAFTALDARYGLIRKIGREPGVEEILKQLLGRIERAYGGLLPVKGQRVLDIACGSSTSRAPAFVYIDTPFGEQKMTIAHPTGYTAQFEPWLCRILVELGAQPVGVDAGDLDAEIFEHYQLDLGRKGALDVFPSQSFDAVHDSRLFGSPEFTERFPDRADRLQVAGEICRQEKRLLRLAGIVIHSDAAGLCA
jgi:hypothetical protein